MSETPLSVRPHLLQSHWDNLALQENTSNSGNVGGEGGPGAGAATEALWVWGQIYCTFRERTDLWRKRCDTHVSTILRRRLFDPQRCWGRTQPELDPALNSLPFDCSLLSCLLLHENQTSHTSDSLNPFFCAPTARTSGPRLRICRENHFFAFVHVRVVLNAFIMKSCAEFPRMFNCCAQTRVAQSRTNADFRSDWQFLRKVSDHVQFMRTKTEFLRNHGRG